VTIAMLAAGAVLLSLFVAIEARATHPLLPLRIVRDRTRGGAFLSVALTYIALFGVFLFLTYYLQRTKGFSPLETGLAFLPLTAATMPTAILGNVVLLRRFGPRPLLTLGMLLAGAAMAWLAQLSPGSSYAGHVVPALIVLGVGFGNVIAGAFASATHGIAPHDAGVASATVNTMQQVGGSIGTALLSSIFASAVTAYVEQRRPTPQVLGDAAVHGYTVAFWVAAGIFALGALAVAITTRSVRVGHEHVPDRTAEIAA
jgi:predicted MFS family arabinose efflux permease